MSFIPDEQTRGLTAESVVPLRYGSRGVEPYEANGLILSMIPEGCRVLDVGCGTGVLSKMIQDLRKCEVVGIEPSPERAEAARELGITIINTILSDVVAAEVGKFDIIILADVLEHLVSPSSMLDLCRKMLNPMGAIIASVPNVAHWTVRFELLRGNFNYTATGIMDATHLRWFTRKTVRRLFETAKLEIVSFQASAGRWMWQYDKKRPWYWFSEERRTILISALTRRWPALCGCQHIVKAVDQRAKG